MTVLTLASDAIDFWALAVAIVAVVVAIIALYQNSETRRVAEAANKIAMGQNQLVGQSNQIAMGAQERADEANDISAKATLIAQEALDQEKLRDKARLRVRPHDAFLTGGHGDIDHRLAVEIVNESVFPVWISSVTLVIDTPANGIQSVFFTIPLTAVDGEPVRRQLDARRSMTILFPGDLHEHDYAEHIKFVRVRTDCGVDEQIGGQGIDDFLQRVRGEDSTEAD